MSDRNSKVRSLLNSKLIETGEKERLKEKLKNMLTECGWRDDMKVCVNSISKYVYCHIQCNYMKQDILCLDFYKI